MARPPTTRSTPTSSSPITPTAPRIAVALDFSLRAKGKSLDDFMRTMWLNHGKPEIPYSMHDARHALITTSGDSAWAVDFWTRYVEGHELPDYAPLLDRAGIVAPEDRTPGNRGLAGTSVRRPAGAAGGAARRRRAAPRPSTARRASRAHRQDTPLYAAGLDAGDVINTVDGKAVTTAAEFAADVAAHKPGDRIDRGVHRLGRASAPRRSRSARIRPCEAVTYEDAGTHAERGAAGVPQQLAGIEGQVTLPLHLIDAFADGPFTGNPAAVVLLDAARPRRVDAAASPWK